MAAQNPEEMPQSRPGVDADGDGMADSNNARMPAISFVLAMLGLVPTLFALRTSITAFGAPAARTMAYVYSVGAIAVATAAIIAAAYGASAKTKSLAGAARAIAALEAIICVVLVVILFFKN